MKPFRCFSSLMLPFSSWVLLIVSSIQGVHGGLVQRARADAIDRNLAEHCKDLTKQVFQDAYEVYRKYAFGHDTISPVSQGYADGLGGWGGTIIDGLSTMHVMGLDDYFHEAVKFVSSVDFTKSKSSMPVSVFEATIRYVGGLLSAYELSGEDYPELLQQAESLASKLVYAWGEANDIPYGHINFDDNTPWKRLTTIAEAGSLTLEFSLLSKYTGNDTYRMLAERSVLHILNSVSQPLPGLPARGINPVTGKSEGGYVTWGSGSDSFFEYLIKYARLDESADPIYADAWNAAVEGSVANLLQYTNNGNWAYLADYDADATPNIQQLGSHLACFYGGNWVLGGKMLDNETIVNIGLQLTDTCWKTYEAMPTGIGPETFSFTTSGDGEDGLYPIDPAYYMRPEVVESNFYAWRATGDRKYFMRAVAALETFNRYLTVNGNSTEGWSGLEDVRDLSVEGNKMGRIDNTETFWFSEVLKYLYLTFDTRSSFDLDRYVFTTEGHPLTVPPATELTTYGSGVPFYPQRQSAHDGDDSEERLHQGENPVSRILGGNLDDLFRRARRQ